MELVSNTHNDSAHLTWLVRALEYARKQNQTKLVYYLETIADDVVFEMEMTARKAVAVG